MSTLPNLFSGRHLDAVLKSGLSRSRHKVRFGRGLEQNGNKTMKGECLSPVVQAHLCCFWPLRSHLVVKIAGL